METNKSIEIIENMFNESKKSLHRNSFYFLMWGVLLSISGISEYLLFNNPNFWMIWPIMGVSGGVISMVYGFRDRKRAGVKTSSDRITSYTWGALMFTLFFAIVYSVDNHLSPHPLVLLLAGSATFISGGITKFKPLIWGGIVIEIGAALCAFYVEPHYHGLVFAISIVLGYLVPGIVLRYKENDKA